MKVENFPGIVSDIVYYLQIEYRSPVKRSHCNTSIEYIQKNYYHADLMDAKAIDNLELGRYSNTFKKGEPYYVTE